MGTYVGGGFLIEALTINGAFSDSAFGPVNIADFLGHQGTPPLLPGVAAALALGCVGRRRR